jgi:hypothetical protein
MIGRVATFSQARYLARVVRATASQPRESIERACEKFAERCDRWTHWPPYEPSPDAEEGLHTALGLAWPCNVQGEFESLWSRLADDLAVQGLPLGRGAFGGWDDGDSGLVRTAWCLTRHLRPEVVIESGVGRGLTTATILRALALNGAGHLWSIDLPPLLESELGRQTGAAVSVDDRVRWTLLRGSTRRLLPGLVRTLTRVDLFIHDSIHTGRNVGFELDRIWPALADGGAALVDDVQRNAAFGRLARDHPDTASFLRRADDGRALFGCLLKPALRRD